MRKIWLGAAAFFILAGGTAYGQRANKNINQPKLLVYAGSGIRPALDECGEIFEQLYGVKIEYSYKGSGMLLADIAFSKRGDLYIPGEIFYMKQAIERGFIKDKKLIRPIAGFDTVIITQKGNPEKIKSVRDFTKPGLKIGSADPEAVAIGVAAGKIFEKAGVQEAVKKNVIYNALNVIELANAVKLRAIDAAIVWNATAYLVRNDVEIIKIPKEYSVYTPIPAGVLKSSQEIDLAKKFLDFLSSKKGESIFQKHGYSAKPVSGSWQ